MLKIFQKECPNLLRDNLWIRKFLSEAFEHIECRIYVQARMALNLQDIIQIINDIIQEQQVIRETNEKSRQNGILMIKLNFVNHVVHHLVYLQENIIVKHVVIYFVINVVLKQFVIQIKY